MRLCIFEAGLMPEEFQPRFESYPEMIQRWLSPHLLEAEFTYVSVVRDEALPEPAAFDGYLITGSRHGVYENLPWMQRLSEFLIAARELPRPVFGICFGHQILAQCFGGEVKKSTLGWAVGSQEYRYNARSGLKDAPSLVFHQDQVEMVPRNARVIASSNHCPIGALAYDFPALSVQYHPEFTKDYVTALIDKYGGGKIPGDAAENGRESLAKLPVDNRNTAKWVAKFFRGDLAGNTAATNGR